MLCKFRGVEFNVKTLTYGRGVNTEEADFLAEETKSQNKKLDNMDFQIQGYIYGKKVEEIRIALENALGQKQGILIMPDGRNVDVKIDDGWHIIKDEEFDDKYNLEFSFKKIDDDNLSLKIIALKELDEKKLARYLTQTRDKISDVFNNQFAYENYPGFVKIQTFNELNNTVSAITDLSTNRALGQIINSFGSFDSMVVQMGGVAAALIRLTQFRDLYGNLSFSDYLQSYFDILNITSGKKKPTYGSDAVTQVYKNIAATEQLIHQSALLEAVDEAVNYKEYTDNQEAEQTIKNLTKVAEKVAFETDNQEIQSAIYQTVNMGIDLIKQKHIVLIEIKNYNRSLPAAVIAHSLYGTDNLAAKAEKIQKQNKVHNALFMPAGVELEV